MVFDVNIIKENMKLHYIHWDMYEVWWTLKDCDVSCISEFGQKATGVCNL